MVGKFDIIGDESVLSVKKIKAMFRVQSECWAVESEETPVPVGTDERILGLDRLAEQ